MTDTPQPTEEKKRLTAAECVVMLGDAMNKGDTKRFYSTLEEYAKGFGVNGNARWRIIQLIRQKPPQLMQLNELSHDLKKLVISGTPLDENVFLNDSISALVDELSLEWGNAEAYNHHNIKVRNKILLYGPTGNGKTTIAKYIASKINRPFIEVKSEEVIDSHLGSTSGNIFKIFNSIKEPCVLFWDEVDSIGCKRGADVKSSAGHENDRMTNTILTNLDRIWQDVIFIAATNRKEVLDSAFVRRFDVQYEIPAPSIEDKNNFATQLLDYYKLPILKPSVENFQSYSDIKNHIVNLARTYIANTFKK